MNSSLRIRSIAITGGVIAALAIGGAVPAAASQPTADVTHVERDRSPIPADFVQIVDDTGVLSIAVPPAWVDIDTAPGTNDDNSTMPWISAATDFEAWRSTFDVPGIVFIGVTYTTDLQSWIDRLGQAEACGTTSATEPYDDGAFQGLVATYEQCGTSAQSTFILLAANVGGDTTRSYVLELQAPTAADLALFNPVLASFNAVGITSTVGAPEATVPLSGEVPSETTPLVPVTLPDGTPIVPATAPGQGGGSTTPQDTDPAVFTPTNSLAEGAVQITDDTRTITLAVPPDWIATATAPVADATGAALPQILASPDLVAFSSGFAAPGVRFAARPFTPDTAAAVTAGAAGLPCTPGAVQAYEDPVFSGHILELTACGGTATRIYLIEANPADQSMTASLLVQVTDADDGDLQTILSSFDASSPETAPGTAPTEPTTTTL